MAALSLLTIIFFLTQEVKEIRIIGNDNLKGIERLLSTQKGQPLNRKAISKDSLTIIKEYEKLGYLWVELTPELIDLGDGVRVEFRIREGKRARIGEVRIIDGESGVATPLVRDGYFTESRINTQIDSLLDWYENNGYPFVSIKPEDFKLKEQKVSYTLKVDRGPKVIITEVDFSGKMNTNPNALRKALGFPKRFLYSENLIKERLKRLKSYEVFLIKNHRVMKRDKAYILNIELEELKSNEVWGGFSYLPPELSGSFHLNFKNILGTLRRAEMGYEKWERNLRFGLNYLEPLGTFSIGINLDHITYDTLYSRTSLFGFSELPKGIFRIKGEIGWERTIPYSQIYWIGSGGSVETMDYPRNPRRGVYGSLLARFGKRNSSEEIRTLLDYEMVLPLYKSLNIFSGLHFRDIHTQDSLNLYDLFSLGGAKSLRGYREFSFFSSRLGWLNNELRLLGRRDSRVFLFWDMGFYKERDYKIKTGYGLGMRVDSRIGVLELDYGIATHTEPLKGKIHISLGGMF